MYLYRMLLSGGDRSIDLAFNSDVVYIFLIRKSFTVHLKRLTMIGE